jgi:AcrR family transcriptional regulator
MAKGTLNQQRIVEAALALADEGGLAAVSMRRLGARLGVEAMSLYSHLPTKDHLIDALVDAVYGEIDLPPGDRSWDEALRIRCLSMHAALGRHPWSVGLLGTRRRPGGATLTHVEAVLACLRRGGFSWSAVGHAVAVLDAYVLGFALQEAAIPLQGPESTRQVADGILSPGLEVAFPHLVAFIRGQALQPGYRFGDGFEPGLDLVLRGLGS